MVSGFSFSKSCLSFSCLTVPVTLLNAQQAEFLKKALLPDAEVVCCGRNVHFRELSGRREQRRSSSTRDAAASRESDSARNGEERKTHSELHPDLVAEVKRLRRASPKTGERLSYRKISKQLALPIGKWTAPLSRPGGRSLTGAEGVTAGLAAAPGLRVSAEPMPSTSSSSASHCIALVKPLSGASALILIEPPVSILDGRRGLAGSGLGALRRARRGRRSRWHNG